MTTPESDLAPQTPRTFVDDFPDDMPGGTAEGEGPPPLEAEAVDVLDRAIAGIDYVETFTIREGIEAFNATRVDVASPQGIISAASQLIIRSEAWYAAHAGAFTLRRPGLYDTIEMRLHRASLLKGREPDAGTRWLVDGAAIAKRLLIAKPDWFDVETLEEIDLIYVIHDWYEEWNARFRNRL